MQEAWVWSLIREDPTRMEQLSLCVTPTGPVLCIQEMQQLGLRAATTEARVPWSPCSETRSHGSEKPEHRN